MVNICCKQQTAIPCPSKWSKCQRHITDVLLCNIGERLTASDRSISKEGLWLYSIVRHINVGVNTILPRMRYLVHQQQVM